MVMTRRRILMAAAAVAATALLGPAPAKAASQCTGLGKRKCVNRAACTWVKSYLRKDKVRVGAHCRLKAKRKVKKAIKKAVK